MMKLMVLYAPPRDAAEFDEYYLSTHMPMVPKIPGLVRAESAAVTGTPDGSPAAYHRVAELYFEDLDALQAGLSSPAGKDAAKDAGALAERTGSSVTFLVANVD
jgi:uncharacterized protein (TIGR02118 family)